MRGNGLHKPVPAHQWRDIIQGVHDGWQHIFIIQNGVQPVGHLGFQAVSKEDRRAEIVISIAPEMHRRGIGYAAMEQAMEMAFKPFKDGGLGLELIWAGVIEDNTASIALFEKSGFVASGSVTNFFRFGPKLLARNIYCLTQLRYKETE